MIENDFRSSDRMKEVIGILNTIGAVEREAAGLGTGNDKTKNEKLGNRK